MQIQLIFALLNRCLYSDSGLPGDNRGPLCFLSNMECSNVIIKILLAGLDSVERLVPGQDASWSGMRCGWGLQEQTGDRSRSLKLTTVLNFHTTGIPMQKEEPPRGGPWDYHTPTHLHKFFSSRLRKIASEVTANFSSSQ